MFTDFWSQFWEVDWVTIANVEKSFDIQLEFYQFFDDCGLEQFLVKTGIKLNTIPGFFSYVTNLYYLWVKLFTDLDWQAMVINDLIQANFSGKVSDWEIVGYHVG